ncbi:isopentenyl diphosphate isomerase/L-lactate dehydrogenase-like FMN-dependent dehydrogenase [Mesorhizobium soli]|uniref:alpha-hydroxy acid oxidase n=1 Tax=Pseudaminobacter soli (ex Li et al. 2025) TaxID=1295366 RepID=UPI0024749A70|nr:alpha-hydroxy acid oxidase [Mesorhizobium soli]MDH6231921.1 isopentenyl diphosphate isomerase/L-lactate dehydrogenase-like FMN-dependent dehydrogenase [Mesorhizobium soli]
MSASEMAKAMSAARMGIPVCISTQSVTTVEEIRDGAPSASLWFQLYVWKNRDLSRSLLERVGKAGVTTLVVTADTLVVTADTPVGPKREYNQRNGFSIPIKPSGRLAWDVVTHPRWLCGVLLRYMVTTGMPTYGHYPQEFRSRVTRPSVAEDVRLENHLNWDDIRDLRRWWRGKLLIKGVLSLRDALKAKEVGADGVVVSAHGARNLDAAPAPIAVLPHIADVLGDKLEILADSGVVRGSDILKYIGSGATSVMVGRLPLWGLAAGGEAGAYALLTMLREEIDITLTMLGIRAPAETRTLATGR